MPLRLLVFHSPRIMLINSGIFAALSIAATVAFAAPTSPYDYAILGMQDVDLSTYSTVIGDVYAGEDLLVDFGYGHQRVSAGDMYARGDFTLELGADVVGDVFTNGDATLGGSSEVTGIITYGTTYYLESSTPKAGGFVHQPNSVPLVALPSATTFSHGDTDVISDNGFILFPGSYRDVVYDGLFDDVYFSSGKYFMRNLSLLNSTKLHLDIVNGQPIEIYVTDDIVIDIGFDVFVNGVLVEDDGSSLSELGGRVLFESHSDVKIESWASFYGTIFAPFGDVEIETQEMYGSILAGRDIRGEVYLTHVPSAVIPEPSALVTLLAGVAILGLAALRRLRRHQ